MKRDIVFCYNEETFDSILTFLDEGYVLDPLFDGKPLRMDNAIVFSLILYESEDEKPKPLEEAMKAGDFDDVISLREVPNQDVDATLREGYVIQNIYAKTAIMIKRKGVRKNE